MKHKESQDRTDVFKQQIERAKKSMTDKQKERLKNKWIPDNEDKDKIMGSDHI